MIDAKDKLKGIYAITPPNFETTKLLDDINICLECGVKVFQIRYKEEITEELKYFFSSLVNQIKNKDGIALYSVSKKILSKTLNENSAIGKDKNMPSIP